MSGSGHQRLSQRVARNHGIVSHVPEILDQIAARAADVGQVPLPDPDPPSPANRTCAIAITLWDGEEGAGLEDCLSRLDSLFNLSAPFADRKLCYCHPMRSCETQQQGDYSACNPL